MGPTAWASVKAVLLSETAAGSCAGARAPGSRPRGPAAESAAPTPSANVNASRRAGVVRSARVAAASAAATAACQHWVVTIMPAAIENVGERPARQREQKGGE